MKLHAIEGRTSLLDTLSAVLCRSTFRWDSIAAFEQLHQCAMVLQQDMETLNGILMCSFPDCSKCWIEELGQLNEEYYQQKKIPGINTGTPTEHFTSGLPESLLEVHTMWLMLQELQPVTSKSASMPN